MVDRKTFRWVENAELIEPKWNAKLVFSNSSFVAYSEESWCHFVWPKYRKHWKALPQVFSVIHDIDWISVWHTNSMSINFGLFLLLLWMMDYFLRIIGVYNWTLRYLIFWVPQSTNEKKHKGTPIQVRFTSVISVFSIHRSPTTISHTSPKHFFSITTQRCTTNNHSIRDDDSPYEKHR